MRRSTPFHAVSLEKHLMRISPVLLAMGGLALAGHALAAPPPDTAGNLCFVPFEVIVKFKDDTGNGSCVATRRC